MPKEQVFKVKGWFSLTQVAHPCYIQVKNFQITLPNERNIIHFTVLNLSHNLVIYKESFMGTSLMLQAIIIMVLSSLHIYNNRYDINPNHAHHAFFSFWNPLKMCIIEDDQTVVWHSLWYQLVNTTQINALHLGFFCTFVNLQ